MRLALIVASLTTLAACGGQPDTAGPERRSAAGEVLGGEVTDDMLPIDSVRSTSPADPRADSTTGATSQDPSPTSEERPGILPKPEVSGGPEPYVEPSEVPPQ
jgi:hypothetical protein